MKFLKPYKEGYIIVLGNGRIMSFDEEELKVMSMAYDELRMVPSGSRRMFSFSSVPIEKVLKDIKERRANKDDYCEGYYG